MSEGSVLAHVTEANDEADKGDAPLSEQNGAAKRHGVSSNLTKKARHSVEQKGMLAFIEPVHAVSGESDWLLPSPQIFFRLLETPAYAP